MTPAQELHRMMATVADYLRICASEFPNPDEALRFARIVDGVQRGALNGEPVEPYLWAPVAHR